MKKSVLIPYERYLYYQKATQAPGIPSTDVTESDTSGKEHDPPGSPASVVALDHDSTAQPQLKLNKDIIIAHLPKRNKSKAEALLNILDQHPVLGWNERGELLVNKTPVPYSHISDLLHDALNHTKHEAVGCRLFYKHLGSIPQSLINNPSRKALLWGGRGVQLPPIGTPNTEPIPLQDWKVLWKST